jgi:hypothetical protein
MSDINDISRMMDQQDIQVLSLDAARALLMTKSNPKTSNSLACAAKLDYMLEGFTMGSNSISEVRTSAENLLESVDDDLGLIYAILTTPEADRGGYSDREVATLGSIKFVDVVHNMMEQMRGYLSGRCKGDVLSEMGIQVSQICENAHRNATIIENHHGSNFYTSYTTNPRPDAFDRILVETVSSGAIGAAIVPAFVGSKKKDPKDVFTPKKKNRWYLKYAIE